MPQAFSDAQLRSLGIPNPQQEAVQQPWFDPIDILTGFAGGWLTKPAAMAARPLGGLIEDEAAPAARAAASRLTGMLPTARSTQLLRPVNPAEVAAAAAKTARMVDQGDEDDLFRVLVEDLTSRGKHVGKPGLSIGRYGGEAGREFIYYGPDGRPVAVAQAEAEHPGGLLRLGYLAADRSKGLLSSRAAHAVAKAALQQGVLPPDEMSTPAFKMLLGAAGRVNK